MTQAKQLYTKPPDIVQGTYCFSWKQQRPLKKKGWWGKAGMEHSDHMIELLNSARGLGNSAEETWPMSSTIRTV